MEISSKHQLVVFLLSIFSGMACALFFDIQRSLRRLYSAGKVRTTAEDILFAIIVTSVLIGLGFFFNRGQIRYYQIMGALSGALFYAAFLSRSTMRFISGIYKIIYKYFIRPIRKLVRCVLFPVGKLCAFLKSGIIKAKRVKKRILKHTKIRFKALKKRMKML